MEDKFEREVLDRLIVIETKVDAYAQKASKIDEAYNVSQKNREDIEEMKDTVKWLWRTAIGAIITGGIGILIAIVNGSL